VNKAAAAKELSVVVFVDLRILLGASCLSKTISSTVGLNDTFNERPDETVELVTDVTPLSFRPIAGINPA